MSNIKKITDVDILTTISDDGYVFVNDGEDIKQIKKSDIESSTKQAISDINSAMNGLVSKIEMNEDTGVFTITYKDGSTKTIDTLLEKIAVNFDFDAETQQLVIELDDGTFKYVDLSAFLRDVVMTTPQSLTEEQKAQVRANIGAGTGASVEVYEYEDWMKLTEEEKAALDLVEVKDYPGGGSGGGALISKTWAEWSAMTDEQKRASGDVIVTECPNVPDVDYLQAEINRLEQALTVINGELTEINPNIASLSYKLKKQGNVVSLYGSCQYSSVNAGTKEMFKLPTDFASNDSIEITWYDNTNDLPCAGRISADRVVRLYSTSRNIQSESTWYFSASWII